ncbi:MAG TPA: hypothetical protein VGF59_08005 [Bryobacteraceae bacterium]
MRKTPQQKKKESYEHDRVAGGEYPHADRKNRPLLKAAGNRALRRTAKQLLESQPEEAVQLPTRPGRTWFKTSQGLATHLTETRQRRIEREAQNIFRRGYGPRTHACFRRVVLSWVEGRTEKSAALASFQAIVLIPPPKGVDVSKYRPDLWERNYFLRRFFSKEPDLKRRFERWLASFQ